MFVAAGRELLEEALETEELADTLGFAFICQTHNTHSKGSIHPKYKTPSGKHLSFKGHEHFDYAELDSFKTQWKLKV